VCRWPSSCWEKTRSGVWHRAIAGEINSGDPRTVAHASCAADSANWPRVTADSIQQNNIAGSAEPAARMLLADEGVAPHLPLREPSARPLPTPVGSSALVQWLERYERPIVRLRLLAAELGCRPTP